MHALEVDHAARAAAGVHEARAGAVVHGDADEILVRHRFELHRAGRVVVGVIRAAVVRDEPGLARGRRDRRDARDAHDRHRTIRATHSQRTGVVPDARGSAAAGATGAPASADANALASAPEPSVPSVRSLPSLTAPASHPDSAAAVIASASFIHARSHEPAAGRIQLDTDLLRASHVRNPMSLSPSFKPLLFAALATLALARPGAAQPTPPTPPGPPANGPAGGASPAPACTPGGATIFAVSKLYNKSAPDAATHPTSVTSVDANGAWKIVTTTNGTSSEAHGCVAKDPLASIKADLDAADWKTTTRRIHCMAMSNDFTTYTVGGKDVYTAKLCQSATPDASSQKAIDAMNQLVATFATTPPCCKH